MSLILPVHAGDKSTSQTSLSNKEIMLKGKPEIRTAKRKYLEKLRFVV